MIIVDHLDHLDHTDRLNHVDHVDHIARIGPIDDIDHLDHIGHLDHLDHVQYIPICRYETLCRIGKQRVQVQCWKHLLGHADHTAPTREHDLLIHHADVPRKT